MICAYFVEVFELFSVTVSCKIFSYFVCLTKQLTAKLTDKKTRNEVEPLCMKIANSPENETRETKENSTRMLHD